MTNPDYWELFPVLASIRDLRLQAHASGLSESVLLAIIRSMQLTYQPQGHIGSFYWIVNADALVFSPGIGRRAEGLKCSRHATPPSV